MKENRGWALTEKENILRGRDIVKSGPASRDDCSHPSGADGLEQDARHGLGVLDRDRAEADSWSSF